VGAIKGVEVYQSAQKRVDEDSCIEERGRRREGEGG
jgi:hypothetical protein